METAIPEQRFPKQGVDVGEPVYLTPYLDFGRIPEGRFLANVDEQLPGMPGTPLPLPTELKSSAGFITVDRTLDKNMFFWFFPAANKSIANVRDAPLVIWLQGGPGSSSMFGLLEIHGPISAEFDGQSNTGAVVRDTTWANNAHMLYIDNPVGAGYSYTPDVNNIPGDPYTAAADMYEFLQQFFAFYTEYVDCPFYAFGESYAGKFVPTIAMEIHNRNINPNRPNSYTINLAGFGIGNGFISPPEASIYAEMMYEASLVDSNTKMEMLRMEEEMYNYTVTGDWGQAWLTWNNEFGYMLSAAGCPHYYDFTRCEDDPETMNFADYMQRDEVRKAVHVGSRPFESQKGDVYNHFLGTYMMSQKQELADLLNLGYRVRI